MTVYDVASPEIIYKDVFKLKEVYELIHDWLDDEGFGPDDRFIEKYYHERRIQNVGKEIRIWWRNSKTPGNSKYYKYLLDVDYFTIAMKDVDIVKDGKKVRANHGELQVKVTGRLVVDMEGFMDKNPFLRPFKRIFEKIWMKKETEYHWAYLLSKVNKLEAEVKTHLQIQNFMKEFTPFRPPY